MPLSWTAPVFDYDSLTFTFNFQNKNNYNLPPLEAAINTVNYIQKNYPKPYVLYLSGGVDSQAMLYAWHLSGVPFKTYSAIYNDHVNLYDLDCLKIFAENLKVYVNFVNFDLYSFLENEHDFYARTYFTGSPHYSTFMKMVDEQKEGTAIMSGNPIYNTDYYYDHKNNVKRKASKSTIGLHKNNLGLLHYANKTGKPFVPFFFLETEYLAHSFSVVPNKNIELSHDFVVNETLSQDTIRIENALYLKKVSYFTNNGFPVICQNNPEKGKFTGFEVVKDYYDKIYQHKLVSLSGDDLLKFKKEYQKLKISRLSSQKSNRYFDIKFRNIYETLIAHHKLIMRV